MDSVENEIKLIRRGDNDAFARLLEVYAPLINSLSDKYVKEYYSLNINAPDITQEATIALYSAVLTYKSGGNVTFGLYAKICIKNRLVSYIRKSIAKVVNDRVSEDIDNYTDSNIPADSNEQPLNALISKENLNSLYKKIKKCLTEYEYAVFIPYSEGTPIKTIAKLLGKDVKSVYNTINRIKTKLQKLVLEGEE